MEDQDRIESSITWPRTNIKNRVCMRIWMSFSLAIPFMDSVNPIYLLIFKTCHLFFKKYSLLLIS